MPQAWVTRLFLLVSVLTITTIPASTHTVEWFNGRSYDYAVLLQGKNCCSQGGGECRPAFDYMRKGNGWILRVPEDGLNKHSKAMEVFVEDSLVTKQDLAGDGVAHTCGSFDEYSGKWMSHCTFIPINERLAQGERFLDARLQLKDPALAGFPF